MYVSILLMCTDGIKYEQDGRICYAEFQAMMTTGMDWKMGSRQYSRAMLNALSVKLFNKDKI